MIEQTPDYMGYFLIVTGNILMLTALILCIIDAFRKKKIVFGVILMIVHISIFFYLPEIENKKYKTVVKCFLFVGLAIGLAGFLYYLGQDIMFLQQ